MYSHDIHKRLLCILMTSTFPFLQIRDIINHYIRLLEFDRRWPSMMTKCYTIPNTICRLQIFTRYWGSEVVRWWGGEMVRYWGSEVHCGGEASILVTNQQANKQTNRQTNKQTNKQTNINCPIYVEISNFLADLNETKLCIGDAILLIRPELMLKSQLEICCREQKIPTNHKNTKSCKSECRHKWSIIIFN